MAKTDAELFEDFKVISGRQDWTEDDFLSARLECHNFFEQIWFLINSFGHICSSSNQNLESMSLIINNFKEKIDSEIARRNI